MNDETGDVYKNQSKLNILLAKGLALYDTRHAVCHIVSARALGQ
jgi:hypothetical protein